jgi:tartrate dehydratase beta subunit/fumarate hydratase class I family protein
MINRAMRKAEVGTISISKDSIHHQLVHLKDKLPHTAKSTVVYHAPCAGKPNEPCDARYIGD